MLNLHEMCLKEEYDTDKYIGKHKFHSYVENIYNDLFEPIRNSTKNVLEIGILYGGSLEMWRDYFSNATIFGVDMGEPCKDHGCRRMVQMMADAYSDSFLEFLPDDYFDIIIDDGPHTPNSQLYFIKNYASKVKKGGLLICEDVASMEIFEGLQANIPIFCKEYCLFDLSQNDRRSDSRVIAIRK